MSERPQLVADKASEFGPGTKPLCPCGCQLTMHPPGEWLYEMHFNKAGFCRLCDKPITSSKAAGTIEDQHGVEMLCPLCLYAHIYSVGYRHAEELGKLREWADDSLE